MSGLVPCLWAASLALRPLPLPEGPLDDSLQNEVDHAVARAETWLAARPADTNALPRTDLFATNGLARRQRATRLVATQRGEGWWVTPTNAVPTRLAVEILKGL